MFFILVIFDNWLSWLSTMTHCRLALASSIDRHCSELGVETVASNLRQTYVKPVPNRQAAVSIIKLRSALLLVRLQSYRRNSGILVTMTPPNKLRPFRSHEKLIQPDCSIHGFSVPGPDLLLVIITAVTGIILTPSLAGAPRL